MKKVFRFRSLIALSVAALLLVMVGCGQPKTGTTAKDPVVIRLAHNLAIDSIDDKAANVFADEVKKNTKGTVEVTVYPAAQLGNERDMLEGIKLGTIDMGINTSAYIMNLQPEFGLLDLPFLFDSYDHVKKVLNGEPGKLLADKLLKEQSMRVLAWQNSGFRVMMTKSTPINSLADLKGRKMRAPEVPVYIDMFKALSANPTPIPFGEVYTSVQTGVVDGVEVCPEQMYTMKFHEVGKYIAVTNHIFSTNVLIISEKTYQKLSDDQKKAVAAAAETATAYQWDGFITADEEALKAMEAAGIKVNELNRDDFKAACESMQAKYAKDLNAADLLDLIKKSK